MELNLRKLKNKVMKKSNVNYNYGWICPRCGKVLAPDVKEGRKCVECPFIDSWGTKKIVDKYADYCEDLLLKNTRWGVTCNNYKPHWNDATFEILEVEVIE